MASAPEEIKLNLPWDFIDASAGLAFDIGSSVMKIVYIHKDDWVEPKTRVKDSRGCVRVVNFSRDQLEKAYAHIKANMHNRRKFPEEILNIETTGIGSAQFDASIKDNLNVKYDILDESTCFHQGFRHLLNHNSRRELLYPLHKPTLEAAKRQYRQQQEGLKKLSGKSALAQGDNAEDIFSIFDEVEEDCDQLLTEDKGLYPCLLMLVGSAHICFVIQEDGTFSVVDITYRAGRTFLALGSMLTDTKTYDGLMALSEKGNSCKISSTSRTVFAECKTEGAKDLYHELKRAFEVRDEEPLFNFGQAVGQGTGDFKKEDIAKCLLETMAGDAIHIADNVAKHHQTKHVFFCGSFAAHPLARNILFSEWLTRYQRMTQLNSKVHKCQPHFLKHGPFLGAIGAFLNSKLKVSE